MDKSHLDFLIASIAADVPQNKRLLIPVSGGSDSALCFWLCNQAKPGKVVGVYAGDNLRSRWWFDSIGMIDYIPAPAPCDYPEGARWESFQELCRKYNSILTGTRNRTEDVFGTYSIASLVATYLPLVGVWKSEIMQLCELIDVPEDVLRSSRRADPDCGRPQELAEIPLELIDVFLRFKAGEAPTTTLWRLTAEQVEYLETIYQYNAFKQRLPIRGPRLPKS